jgi:hypothetical protein
MLVLQVAVMWRSDYLPNKAKPMTHRPGSGQDLKHKLEQMLKLIFQ